MQQKIRPNLWFDGNAEEAASYYCSVFKDARVVNTLHYPEGSDQAGSVLTVEWELNGQRFMGINGGPQFKFTEAVSFEVTCEDQAEIDYYWDALSEGGEQGPCGWLKDKYGLSWQIVPTGMDEMFAHPDKSRAARAFQAMMGMRKLDIAALHAAADGEAVAT